MKPAPHYSDQERAEHIAFNIALEIARILDDLEQREAFLIDMWGRHRDRGPFLDTLFSRYRTLSFTDLALLPTEAVCKIEEFYRELEEFRLYVRFTEEMPTSLEESYRWQVRRLSAYAEQAVDSLGGTPERPLLDIPDSVPDLPRILPRRLLELDKFEKGPESESEEE